MPKRQQLIANLVSNLVAQERSGHLERSGRPGAIWSPIRSPEHLVVDLVLVDAFSSSISNFFWTSRTSTGALGPSPWGALTSAGPGSIDML